MKVLDPGHCYELKILDGNITNNILQFVKREGEKYPGNIGNYAGTTIQEVMRAIIDRLKYVNNQIPCAENEDCIYFAENIVYNLEVRAAKRHNREINFDINDAVYGKTCNKCNHIGCGGECH